MITCTVKVIFMPFLRWTSCISGDGLGDPQWCKEIRNDVSGLSDPMYVRSVGNSWPSVQKVSAKLFDRYHTQAQ